jgi:hypothetical protein
MCDQDHFDKDRQDYEALGLVTRKQFGIMLGAGVAMMLPQVANAAAVTESDVSVKTPDGTADCYFVHPANGTAPGVLVWPDIFGLRPAFRQMGKRLAESGYSVLVVNPFYRTKKAPTADAGAAGRRRSDGREHRSPPEPEARGQIENGNHPRIRSRSPAACVLCDRHHHHGVSADLHAPGR